jgi:hypothetical protein
MKAKTLQYLDSLGGYDPRVPEMLVSLPDPVRNKIPVGDAQHILYTAHVHLYLTSYNRCQNIRTFPLKETFIKI